MLVAERPALTSSVRADRCSSSARPARPDRAALLATLAAKRLDRTLTTALPPVDPADALAVGATAVPAFDASLGGFPRGQLSEIVGARSSGRTSLLMQMLAAATARGELAAVVDALDRFDPASALAAGVDLDRVLWIRGQVMSHPAAARDTNQKALEQAVKALSLVLQAGNFGLVAFDVGEAPADALRRLPFTTWLRVQRMVEGQQAVCVLIGTDPMARSAAGLTVNLTLARPADGRLFDGRLFTGLKVEARVIRARAHCHEGVSLRFETKST